MPLVAGVDSSTQSCKVVIRDADTGRLVREGRAAHPDGTEVHPLHWWEALQRAAEQAGGLEDVQAIAVAGQQHGMVCLDEEGEVVRPALLWNDTRSATAAEDLICELGHGDRQEGAARWAESVGSVPVPSFTVTKLRWLASHEPHQAARTAAVCLPHDWLSWKLRGTGDLDDLTTDRSDASGTGYWSPSRSTYVPELLELALGQGDIRLPRVAKPFEITGVTSSGALLAPGAGDNAGAALGLALGPGDVVVSVGTSGVVSAVSDVPAADPTGTVAGFADATGRFLPLVCTLNAARVLDAFARLLGTDHAGLSDLALSAPPGADGLVLVPYLEGERTPNRPDATGALHGLTLATSTPAHMARAAVEGLLCGLADGLDALRAQGARVERVLLIGGGAASEALRRIAPAVLGTPVVVPPPGEYVADGAARQAACVLADGRTPAWSSGGHSPGVYEADAQLHVRGRYAEVRDLTDGVS
ncbi:MAG TPA: xylulokinase [Actinomycetales bacterium]|nr:xylulokinase [Actinomycetales bacterium]